MAAPKPRRKASTKPSDAEQSKRFIQMAREIGAAEDEETAQSIFKKVVVSSARKPGKRLEK